jgi:hypothetical protein
VGPRFGSSLRRCEGFRVDSPNGRVGFVEELRYGSSLEAPDAVAVRAGLFGRLLLIIPTEEIEEIFPRERRVLLRRSPRLTGTERVRELGRHLRPRPEQKPKE